MGREGEGKREREREREKMVNIIGKLAFRKLHVQDMCGTSMYIECLFYLSCRVHSPICVSRTCYGLSFLCGTYSRPLSHISAITLPYRFVRLYMYVYVACMFKEISSCSICSVELEYVSYLLS